MLHELTHNVHGPHDEKFYAFLKVLNDEYDGLISGGYSGSSRALLLSFDHARPTSFPDLAILFVACSSSPGEGFLSNGTRVGVGVAHDLPPHLAKAKALAAAEERAKKQRLMGPGGKIGGVKRVGKTPRELAADVSIRDQRKNEDVKDGDDGLLRRRETDFWFLFRFLFPFLGGREKNEGRQGVWISCRWSSWREGAGG